jgi:hypothetical protein
VHAMLAPEVCDQLGIEVHPAMISLVRYFLL